MSRFQVPGESIEFDHFDLKQQFSSRDLLGHMWTSLPKFSMLV